VEAALFNGDGSGLSNIGSASVADNSLTAADVDWTSLQVRVAGNCPLGQSIRVIEAAGSVACEVDSDASTFCPDGTFLNGDGTCDPVASLISSFTQHTISNNGGGDGVITVAIGASANRFCALSAVRVENTDQAGETAYCSVEIDAGTWELSAGLGDPTKDANVFCQAYCFQLGV
jgi:hypothetical protein